MSAFDPGHEKSKSRPKTISVSVVKRRNTTKAKTRHPKSVRRKGSKAPMIARRDNSRVANLEKKLSALARELAEAREADRQVLHSAAQFAVLVQSIKEYAIYMMDSTGHIISWNGGAERIKGYSRDEIIGQHFSCFYVAVDRKSGLPTNALRQAVLDGKFEEEGWRVRKDGSQFWASVVIDPIYDGGGTLIGFAKVTRDVTDRRQAQDLLEQKNKDLELFATRLQRERDNKLMNAQAITAAITHEVKQPLAAIVTSGGAALRFLDRTPPELEEVRTVLKRMISDSHRTSDVLDGIRALFGKNDQKRLQVDVNEIILGVLQSSRKELQDRGVETRVELGTELPLVDSDGRQLEEVIFNLVHNAIEAMDVVTDRPRVLRVGTELTEHNAITVTVQDSGPGIDPQKLDGVFGAFFTTKSHGMGLGLAICRMIVEHHGGQLIASSDGKQGALFQFNLPIESTEKGIARGKEATS